MTLHQLPVDLGPGVRAVFTGRATAADDRDLPAVGAAGNLSHRRPHRPGRLAADRARAAAAIGLVDDQVVRMRQVHGSEVAIVDDATPVGAEVGPADAVVTTESGRGLTVLTADCVPVVLAGREVVAVAHAGRAGVLAGVVEATSAAVRERTSGPVRAVIGPAIRGCCYEVEEELRAAVASDHPDAFATTTWGTPSLDLPAAVRAQLDAHDIEVDDVGACTHCDPRWFSHRRDGDIAGRQAGMVVRHDLESA